MEIHSNSPKLYYGFNNKVKIVEYTYKYISLAHKFVRVTLISYFLIISYFLHNDAFESNKSEICDFQLINGLLGNNNSVSI